MHPLSLHYTGMLTSSEMHTTALCVVFELYIYPKMQRIYKYTFCAKYVTQQCRGLIV